MKIKINNGKIECIEVDNSLELRQALEVMRDIWIILDEGGEEE